MDYDVLAAVAAMDAELRNLTEEQRAPNMSTAVYWSRARSLLLERAKTVEDVVGSQCEKIPVPTAVRPGPGGLR